MADACVSSTTFGLPAAAPQIETVAPLWKRTPVRFTVVPPPAGPDVGAIEASPGAGSSTHGENSDVFPAGSVAVAVSQVPGAGIESVASISARPVASVVTATKPRKVSPWPLP